MNSHNKTQIDARQYMMIQLYRRTDVYDFNNQ